MKIPALIKITLLVAVLHFTSLSAYSQEDSLASKQQIISNLKTLTVSFSGNAQNCIPYDVYAFKYKKSWFIVMLEGENLAMFVTNPPRSEEKLYVSSDYLLDGISRIIPNKNYYAQKNRRKVVNDIEIYPFYKLKKRGKQVMKGLLLLELPDTEESKPFFLFRPFIKKKEELEEKAPLKRDFEESIQKAKDAAESKVEEGINSLPELEN